MSLEDAGYHVLGPIARGAMAEVVLAERIGPGGVRKRLAIKRLLPELASEPGFITMLENEARIAVELEHANIVSVFEFGEADGELFLAMEFVRGWDLATVLEGCAKRGEGMPPELAIHVAHEVCHALAYAHTKTDDRGAPLGIVHRDVSPSNVLLSADGRVMLTDFGIARASAVAQSTQGMWLRGKVPYASPEQVAGKSLDPSSDLYSLAVLLFEMLTGRRLFSSDVASAERERAAPLPRITELVPEARGVQPVLDRALAFAKKDRFGSTIEMVAALSHVTERLPSRPTAADVAVYLAALALPPPVSPDNVDEGERTEIVTGEPIFEFSHAAQAHVPHDVAEPAPDRTVAHHGDARMSSWWMALVAAVAFFAAMIATAKLDHGRSPPTTRLDIRTTTPGLPVWIDGAQYGLTPVVAHDLSRAPHRVIVGSPSAAPHDVDLRAIPDQTLDLDVR
jgi:serine/threonine-protein kinase